MSDCCNEFSRASVLRRAAAEAGQGLPAIESGMPLPAGTGLDRRSFLARSVGLALAVYGAAPLRRASSRRASPMRLPRPRDTVLVSIFMDGGADSLSLLFPHGDPDYRRLPAARAARLRARLLRGLPPPVAPVGGGVPDTARRGQALGPARRSATPAPISPTSRRATTGRSARRTRACAPAGSGATSTASAPSSNPLQGLSLDGDLAPSLATAASRRRASRRRRVFVLVSGRLGPGRDPDARGGRPTR